MIDKAFFPLTMPVTAGPGAIAVTLSLVLEQMGLASPSRYVFCIRDYQLSGSDYVFFVTERNFDPVAAQPSPYVNDNLFAYYISQFTLTPTLTNAFCDAVDYAVDPLLNNFSTVADFNLSAGFYATNHLSR